MKKYFSAFLCGVMLCCSHNVQAGLFEGLFLSSVSMWSHIVGSGVTALATVIAMRGVLSGASKKSETKQIMGAIEGIGKFFVGQRKDDPAPFINWFSEGNLDEDLGVALVLGTCALGLHSFGFLTAYAAGRTTAKPRKRKSF